MLSVPHLIIIFLVALIVFGPEKLPELARNFGKIMAQFQRASGDLRSTFEEHLRDLERETDERRIGAPPPVAAFPVTGEARESAPANAVPTTPLSARSAGSLPETNDLDGSEPTADLSGPHAEAALEQADQRSPESVLDPSVALARSNRRAEAKSGETETNPETVSDGHSPS